MSGMVLLLLALAYKAKQQHSFQTKPRPPSAEKITGPDQLYFEPHQDEHDGIQFNVEHPWLEARFEDIKGAGYGVIEEVRLPFGPNPHAHEILTPDIITDDYNYRYAMNLHALQVDTVHPLMDPLLFSRMNNTPGAYFIQEP